jgi:hypothetical protein
MSDLWPSDLANSNTTRSPVFLLKEQASLLGGKTKNIVNAVVKRRNPREEEDRMEAELRRKMRLLLPESAPFNYAFLLVAPALDNYRYRLFSIAYGLEQYPVQFEVDKSIGNEFQRDPKFKLLAANEDEFVEILGKVLASKKTRQVVQAILTESLALSDVPGDSSKTA